MSVTNLFETRRKGFILRNVTVSGIAYDAKVGRPEDGYIYDRVIDVDLSPATVAIPNGVYEGQRILIRYSDADTTGAATINAVKGDDVSLNELDEFVSLEWVNDTAGWQILGSHE